MNNLIERKWCTKGTVYIEDLTGTAFTGEDGGHTFVISGVTPDGTAVTLAGTVAGAYILPDGSTQPLTGSIVDGKAQVTLDPECYALPGRGQLTIFLMASGQKVAIYGAVLNVARSSTTQVPPAIAADVADLVQDIEEARATIPASYTDMMASLAKNYADLTYPISAGTYAWQDGWMYRAKVDITSAESWTAAHWEKVPLADSMVGELSSLKSALPLSIDAYDNGGLKLPGDFEYGTLNSSGNIESYSSHTRCVSPEYYTAQTGDILVIKTGYSSIVCEYNSGKTLVNRGVKAPGEHTLTAGNLYRVCVYISGDSTPVSNPLDLAFVAVIKSKTEKRFLSDETRLTKAEIEIANDCVIESAGAFTSGSYVNTSGAVSSVSYASLSGKITARNAIAVKAFLTSALSICFYDANDNFLYYVNDADNSSTSGTPKVYSFVVPENADYFKISNAHTMYPDADVVIYRAYESEIKTIRPAYTAGKYVSLVQEGRESSVSYAQLTDFINSDGVTDFYTALSGTLAICYYDLDKNYLGGMIGTNGEAPSWRKLNAPANTAYIRISNDTRNHATGMLIKIDRSKQINKKLSDVYKPRIESSYKAQYDIIPMYDDVICIGDSLTASQVWVSDSSAREAYKKYPMILADLCGITGHVYATPGDTAILWWSRSSQGAFDNHGLYIVFLGTNGGFTDTISTDCVGTDPANFANTNTGQYGRILQTITNNGDKAVLILPWAGGGDSLETTQDVIEQFGTKYSFPVISIDTPERTNPYYHYYPDKSGVNNLHFTDLGYTWMANEVKRQIDLLPVSEQWNIRRTQ